MSLMIGARLGPYEIDSPLGAGGFGEVYKARDTRLDRAVAIKILPSADPELKARFEREAKAIAALQHPHICTLFDVGHQDGTDYLVLEYLDGETLAQRLERGLLKLDDALKIAVEIADGLDKAHRAGIVHRDLKPGNIMVTKEGVKLLDFGLAKLRPAHTGVVAGMTAMVTQQTPLTGQGTIVGTLQYMAPEQLEGKEADHRADMWALGCIVYEMATGKKAFEGASQASVIAAILDSQPPPMSAIRRIVSPSLDWAVGICLAKHPDDRWQSAGDLMRELKRMDTGWHPEVTLPAVSRRQFIPYVLMGAVIIVLLALVGRSFFREAPPTSGTLRFGIAMPGGTRAHAVSVSPDGQRFAFIASTLGGPSQLWVTPQESHVARPFPGTDGATYPFWSPDSRFIAFFADGKLKRIDASGQGLSVLCDARLPRGGSWSQGTIIFAVPGGGLWRVPDRGGAPVPVTTLDPSKEDSHRWPAFLPDGRHFLYFVRGREPTDTGVYLGSLDSTARKQLVNVDSLGVYVPPGFLLYVRDGRLLAQAFDTGRLTVTGDPATVAEEVWYDPAISGLTNFSMSETGVLAYRVGGAEKAELTWFDRAGTSLGHVGPPSAYLNLALSLDEKKLAVSRADNRINTRVTIQGVTRFGSSDGTA